MEKKLYLIGALVLVVAFASIGAYAQDMIGKRQPLSCDRNDLLGAIVKNSKGDVIGIVNRIEDEGGQSFAIINHGPDSYYGDGGGYTPVPVGALKIAKPSEEQSNQVMTVVLNKTEKQLEAAPFWDLTRMNDRKYEAKIDRFFGVQPKVCA